MTSRLLSLLLAFIITAPDCWCRESDASRAVKAAEHSCCQSTTGEDQTSSTPGKPDAPCSCNKCLVKRTLANDQVQVPAMTWVVASPIVIDWEHAVAFTRVSSLHFPVDTGPPHERRAIFARHCALLL